MDSIETFTSIPIVHFPKFAVDYAILSACEKIRCIVSRQSILLLEIPYLRLMKQYWFSHFIH